MNKRFASFTFSLAFLLSAVFLYKAMMMAVEPNSAAFTTASTARISVNPPTSKAVVGQTFMIDINISDVVDLYGWEFKLRWNSTLLDALNVTEGNFLKSGGDTFFASKINNTAGYMLVDCTLLGKVSGVSGNGILATVEFYVEARGECVLDLYDTNLVSSLKQPITHTTIDGYYYTPIHDVAVIDLVSSETTVNVTVENQGTEIETFDVSTYYTLLTDPLIGTQTITLTHGTNSTLTFMWTPPSPGRYEIRAEADIVPGENDIADNTRAITISIGYSSRNSSSKSSSESINGYHIGTFILALFASVMIFTFRNNREIPLFDIPATALKQSISNNLPNYLTNIRQDWIRRQPI